VHEDFYRSCRAVQSKDTRFDGCFVTVVHTTGIYCRPAVQSIHRSPAAAAQRADFRACKRCRPDASPGSPESNMRDDLTARLGDTTRQLQRLLQEKTGAGPLALTRAQRTQTARILAATTDLPLVDIASAARFSSIRQFNETVRSVFERTLTVLRRHTNTRGGLQAADARTPGTVALRLPVRVPFAHAGVFGQLAASVVPGYEVAKTPGQRIPRTVDEAGLAVRVVLGHHASMMTAGKNVGRLLTAAGHPIHEANDALRHTFASTEQLSEIDPAQLSVPASRRRTVTGLIAGPSIYRPRWSPR